MTDIDELARRVYACAHLTGSFTLRSGQVADTYFDKFQFEADPVLLSDLADAMVPLIPRHAEVIAGPELGGVPLATVLSAKTGLEASFVRKQRKNYGTERIAEGAALAGRRVAVVEDVVTTAGQLLESCADLRAEGAELVAVLCVIDREAGGREALAEIGVDLVGLLTRSQLERAAS